MPGDDRWILCSCLGERFAVHLRWAQEIIYRPQLLPLPGLEPPLDGVLIWQGSTLPVIGLRLLAGSDQAAPRPAAVVVGAGEQRAALLADDIGDTVSLPPGDLFALSPVLTSGRPYLTQGAMLAGSLLFLIDVPALLQQLREQAGQALAQAQPAAAQ
ncbi:MAG TPA: chemotaxis protein CheW [Candidatus Edwardsbacteria bacterium]|nr:chemotaxis protein CheW [Candidatus Edwardsbacteria bacterium]